MIAILAVFVMDDGSVWLLRMDGTFTPHLPGGHPRPGASHATATAARAPMPGRRAEVG